MRIIFDQIRKFKITAFTFFVIGLILLGLFLRLYPDSHEIIWSYDQARDSFTMRKIFTDLDIKLIGPQTEIYGLFHGPLFYYLLGPFFCLSKGEVFLPVIAMTILTYSSVIPLSLLSCKITKDKWSILFVILFFSISYQFIEYGRWLSNVSVAIPFLSWSYYFFYKTLKREVSGEKYLLLGFTLGLAIQGELFLASLAGMVFIFLLIKKTKFKYIFSYLCGGVLGTLPLVISEIKFKFRGAGILFNEILIPSSGRGLLGVIRGYWEHLGITSLQVLGGFTKTGGYVVLTILLLLLVFCFKDQKKKDKNLTSLVLVIFLSHFLLFFFAFVNAVFLDMEISLLMILLMSIIAYKVYEKRKLYGFVVVAVLILFQMVNYRKYVVKNRPLDHFGFIQQPSTLLHKEEILDVIYDYAGDREFTFASIGTPYGVRTVWASIFELHLKDTGQEIPNWYGYHANGYPGEELIQVVKEPDDLHILLIESNIDELLAKPIVDQEISNQNTHTKVVGEIVVNDTKVQFREKI